jgi:Cryptococcal mannosyltransferase 1
MKRRIINLFLASFLVFLILTWSLQVHEELDLKSDHEYNYFIAANYYNCEDSLIYSLPELLKVINYLNTNNNVYFSLLENGSKDNTRKVLEDFESNLDIPHRFQFCNFTGSSNWKLDRILEDSMKALYKLRPYFRYQKMAAIRNAAIEPLYSLKFNNTLPVKVIFLNDIYFRSDDILKLIRTNNGKYDIVCGLDFYYEFYDVLVARDIDGYYFSGNYPYVRHSESQKLLKNNKPFKVKACWNGGIVMNADGILKDNIKFRGRRYGEGDCECLQSECLLICLDYYLAGYKDIYINPDVRVSYEWKYFMLHKIPGLRDFTQFIQSFYYHFTGDSTYNHTTTPNQDIIWCSMPPYSDIGEESVYMSLNSTTCALNSTSYSVYSETTDWQVLEKSFQRDYYSLFIKTC